MTAQHSFLTTPSFFFLFIACSFFKLTQSQTLILQTKDFNTQSCGTNCNQCVSSKLCYQCAYPGLVVNDTGYCVCPAQQFFSLGNLQCQGCMSKCSSCLNEWSCTAYQSAQNSFQTLTSNSQIFFNCSSGYFTAPNTCLACADSNCQLCTLNATSQQQECGLCQNGYYLDLTTYTCVASCSNASQAIVSYNTNNLTGSAVQYCRPYSNSTANQFSYYVDPYSQQYFELGTYEFPFKNMDPPAKEIFNFMYNSSTSVTIYIKRGTSMWMHDIYMPVYILNLQLFKLTTYGNMNLQKPVIYLTDIPYQWPDSTWFSITELGYNVSMRLSRGDLSASEAAIFALKFQIFRSNVNISSVDFFTTMIGNYIRSNMLFAGWENYNKVLSIDNCSMAMDGFFVGDLQSYSSIYTNSVFNITLVQAFFFLRFSDNCLALKRGDIKAWLTFQNNTMIGTNLYGNNAIFQFSSNDNFIVQNNLFINMSFPILPNRPFFDCQYNANCEMSNRTQLLVFDSNRFVNLQSSGIQISYNYIATYLTNRILVITNNYMQNCSTNIDFFYIQFTNQTNLVYANNTYSNCTIQSGYYMLNFNAPASTLSISNETICNCIADDFYYVISATQISMSSLSVSNSTSSGTMTSSSGLFRIVYYQTSATIQNIYFTYCNLYYSKGILIESGQSLSISNVTQTYSTINEAPLIKISNVYSITLSQLNFSNLTKTIVDQNYIISLNQLSLSQGVSQFMIQNVSLSNSSVSFLTVTSVSLANAKDSSAYSLTLQNIVMANNSLPYIDTLFNFGSISYYQLVVLLQNISFSSNQLSQGSIIQTTMNIANMSLTNITFSNNEGSIINAAPAVTMPNIPLVIYIKSSSFYQNSGKAQALIVITSNTQTMTNLSTFQENYSYGRGSIILADYLGSKAVFGSCSFINNYAYYGGIFYVQYSSIVTISNSYIYQNFAVQGGVGYVDNDGLANINDNSVLIYNAAINTCLLLLINTQAVSTLKNVIISNNDQASSLFNKSTFLNQTTSLHFIQASYLANLAAYTSEIQNLISSTNDYSIMALKASLTISNSLVTANDQFLMARTNSIATISNTVMSDILFSGSIMQIISSTLTMTNCTLSNINQRPTISVSSYKLSILSNSVITITQSNFSSIQGPFLQVSSSTMLMQTLSAITNLSNSDTLNPLFTIDTSDVLIFDTNLNYLSQLTYPYMIYLIDSTFSQVNSSIYNFDKTLFSVKNGDIAFINVDIKNGSTNILSGINSVVFQVNSANLLIQDSSFTGICTSLTSPIVNIQNSLTNSAQINLTIVNSTFTSNCAQLEAGVIYSYYTNVNITNSSFIDNHALQGDAGVLYLDCPGDLENYICSYNIQNSTFVNNSALINGGAILYNYYAPLLTNNTFSNNEALYGNDIASYATQISLITQGNSNWEYLSQYVSSQLGFTSSRVISLLALQVSGQLIADSLQLMLLDQLGQIVVSDNSTTITLAPVSQNVTLMKDKSVKAINGVVTFDSAIVIGQPGTQIYLSISADSIDPVMIQNVYGSTPPSLVAQLYLRYCGVGEYESSDKRCAVCDDGFYNLDLNQTQCQSCPSEAYCTNGYDIMVKQGYWRRNIKQSDIYKCFNTEACLSSKQIECAPGYGGNLCGSCVEYNNTWYFRNTIFNCTECIESKTQSLQIFGIVILIAIYMAIMIYYAFNNAANHGETIVCLRILTGYFQLLTITQSFYLQWTSTLQNFLEYIAFIGKGQNYILSIDCFVKERGYHTQPFYLKMIIVLLFLIGGILVLVLFWTLYGLIKKNKNYTSYLIQSVTILVYTFLPTIAATNLQIFNCVDFASDGTSYLMIDLDEVCWKGDHEYYALRFGLPTIFVWIVGFPLAAFIYLFKNRDALHEDRMRRTLGFVYIGLKEKSFYWELLNLFLKILIIVVNVFLSKFDVMFKAVCAFIILITFVETQQHMMPYESRSIHLLQLFSIIATVIISLFYLVQFSTFYGGLFFITDTMSQSYDITILMSILAANIIFWVLFVKEIFKKQYKRLKAFAFKKLCNKKFLEKREKQMQAQIVDDDSEFQDSQRKGILRQRPYLDESIGQENKDGQIDLSEEPISLDGEESTVQKNNGNQQRSPKQKDLAAIFEATQQKSKKRLKENKKTPYQVKEKGKHKEKSAKIEKELNQMKEKQKEDSQEGEVGDMKKKRHSKKAKNSYAKDLA